VITEHVISQVELHTVPFDRGTTICHAESIPPYCMQDMLCPWKMHEKQLIGLSPAYEGGSTHVFLNNLLVRYNS
jgi:hypothetical protein